MVTGRLEQFSRSQVQDLIKQYGGAVSGSVSKNTRYLVAGEGGGSKLADAQRLEVEVLTEDELPGYVAHAVMTWMYRMGRILPLTLTLSLWERGLVTVHRCQFAESGSHPQGRGPQSGRVWLAVLDGYDGNERLVAAQGVALGVVEQPVARFLFLQHADVGWSADCQ